MNMSYSIREITADDLSAWWELRLLALQSAPDAFGSDYETMKAIDPRPLYLERGYLSGGANTLFAAFDDNGAIVAQAGVFAETGKRNHIAQVISVFTHPEHRGLGLATALVQLAIDHLTSFPQITSIRISVNADNMIARRAYENLGFVAWGKEPDAIRGADGSLHAELHMVLRSKDSR